jgi:hypothetical protein
MRARNNRSCRDVDRRLGDLALAAGFESFRFEKLYDRNHSISISPDFSPDFAVARAFLSREIANMKIAVMVPPKATIPTIATTASA